MGNRLAGKRIDVILLSLILLLVITGLLMVISSTMTKALALGDPFFYVKRQGVFILAGLAALYFGAVIDHMSYKKISGWLLGIAVILLLLVYAPVLGRTAGGASRWIDLGFLSFQPSEFAKLASIIFIANALAVMGDRIKDLFKGFLPLMAVIGSLCFLVFRQPDLGTTIMIFGTGMIMLYMAGARPAHLLGTIVLSAGFVFVTSFLTPYKRNRMLAFVDPWKDPQGIGYHIIQSLIAVGSGGLFGLGLGASRQKFLYLPEQYTDFIFAILCEEWGFIGAAAVVLIFIAVVSRGLRIARLAQDRFSMLLAGGISAYIGLQALINISVVLGMCPATGIPLPFISYGGTSLIVLMYSAGILLNISAKG